MIRHLLVTCLTVGFIWLAAPGCAPDSGNPARSAMAGHRSIFKKKGRPWTIRCIELQGPYAADYIEQLADTLRRTPGIRAKDVFAQQDSDGVFRLYYGTYYRSTDPETGRRSIPPQLRDDLVLIKELTASQNQHIFIHAMKVPMPTPDVGDPAWALQNVRAMYTLQVAVFEPNDEFLEYKQAAATYCKYLRDQGFEAYYYHTPASSMVTVGSFGPEAIIKREEKVRLPATGETGTVVNTYYSDEVVALQQHELLKYNLVNGAKVRERVGNRLGTPVASQLVQIPRPEEQHPW